jgi:hypothetical protein
LIELLCVLPLTWSITRTGSSYPSSSKTAATRWWIDMVHTAYNFKISR